jgi:anti-anti-sigma factor
MSPELFWGTMPFWVSVDRVAERLVVTPRGELDLATAPALEQAVADALAHTHGAGPIKTVVFDFGGLQFIDVAGARAIRRCEELAQEHGADFSAGNASRQARFVFELCGMGHCAGGD